MQITKKLFLILTICLIILTGCSSSNTQLSVEEKNTSELEYLEDKIIHIMNKLIKDEYLNNETGEQNWEEILSDARKIENAMSTTLVDLASLNIDSAEISKLSTSINNMIIAIENNNETNLIVELNNIYALIPNYLSKYLQDTDLIFKKRLKYLAISTYVAFSMGDLELAKTQIGEAEKQYGEKMNDVNYVQNNEYNVNKIYVLIQELKNAVEANSYELVKSKYLLLVEEI